MRPIVSLMFLVAACGGEPDGAVVERVAAPPVAPSTPMADHDGRDDAAKLPYDQMFLDSIVANHQGAVEMTAMADLRGERPELKEWAKKVHDAREAETLQLRDLRKSWYGSPDAPGLDALLDLKGVAGMPGMKSMKKMKLDLSSLNDAKPFDRAFLDAMIAQHEGAIEIATDAQQNAEHPEIKDMASKMISDQQKEIGEMQALRAAWYPEKQN